MRNRSLCHYLHYVMPAAVVLASAVLVALAYRPLIGAQYSWIDDHDNLVFAFGSAAARLARVPSEIHANSEIFGWGTWVRYRPIYYLERILVNAAIGTRPTFWFALRQVEFFATVAMTGLGALAAIVAACARPKRSSPLLLVAATIAALAVSTLVVTLGAWSDIYTRLGPSESLAMLGASMTLLGIAATALNPRTPRSATVTVGAVIMAGSKENFAIYAACATAIFLALVLIHQVPKTRLTVLLPILGFGWSAFVLVGVKRGVQTVGHDVYGRSASSIPISTIARQTFENSIPAYIAIIVLTGLVGTLAIAIRPRGIARSFRWFTILGASALILALFLAAESVFYFDSPPALRYQVFSEYLQVTFIIVGVAFAFGAVTRASRRPLGWVFLTLAVLVGSLVAIQIPDLSTQATEGYRQLLSSAEARTSSSREFEARLASIATASRANQNVPVVLKITDPASEYEATASIARFLTLLYGRNVYAVLDPSAEDPVGLARLARDGWSDWRLLPSSSLPLPAHAVCVSDLSGTLAVSTCELGG
jgi:hypothetical protein